MKALSSFAVQTSGLPEDVTRKLPRYSTDPATLIGRLSRDAGQPGIGGLLLADALKRILASSRAVGSALVVVEAKCPEDVAFYQKFGFISFIDNSQNLFLRMQTIASAEK